MTMQSIHCHPDRSEDLQVSRAVQDRRSFVATLLRMTTGSGEVLGLSRNAKLVVRQELVTLIAVAATEEVRFEDHRGDRWQQRSRVGLVVYEIADGRICRIIEYWITSPRQP